jgi:hypothetical protein
VSRELRVEYSKLKRRCEQARAAEATAVVPTFVAVEAGSVIAGKRAAGGDGEMCGGGRVVMEFFARQGDRMRVELPGSPGVDVSGLVHAFWRRG